MDETQSGDGVSWWQDTLDFVVRAAAVKRFSTPQLQSGQSYYVDANGNVLPSGYPAPGAMPQAAASALSNPMVMMAGLALVGVLLYKLVK